MSGSGFVQRTFIFGLLIWMVCSQTASADTHIFCADVSVGVHAGDDNTFTPGQPCTITSGGTDSATDYMLVRFDFTGWPAGHGVTSVKLRLTKSDGSIPSPYTVNARGFYSDNNHWYLHLANASGNHQYYDKTGSDHITWKNSSGNEDTIEKAGNDYLGIGSTWDGYALEISLNADKVQNWITGATANNGLRLYGNRTVSPFFYGSGAANQADYPTLIIEADVPEPGSLFILSVSAFGLLFKRRRRHRQFGFTAQAGKNSR